MPLYDSIGELRRVVLTATLVPRLRRHLFSAGAASVHGVTTLLSDKAFIKTQAFKVGLRNVDSLYHLDLMINCKDSNNKYGRAAAARVANQLTGEYDATALAAAQPASADVWHRRLGYLSERVLREAADIRESGIVVRESLSQRNTCALDKSARKKHPQTEEYKITMPLERVHMDLLGPVYPAAEDGMQYVSKSTDEFTRFMAVYVIHSKNEALDTLTRYMQDLAIPNGLRVQHLRSNGGGEYRASIYRQLCSQTGIQQEFMASNTPHQNGMSERDGRTLRVVTKSLL